MGSVGNQNPWAPYNNNYRDCSQGQGVCSLYCPQFCYFFFPPPPPSNDGSSPFSPLIIAVIGVLASAFLLVSYYTVVTRYCNRRRHRNSNSNSNSTAVINHEAADQMQWRSGLDESVIRAIAVRVYRKGDGVVEGTECAVCLSEFRENESLRLLPKCKHAFHLPCIDTWLKSQSSCPLCRAGVVLSDSSYHQEEPGISLRVDGGDLVLDDETVTGEDHEEEGIVVIKRFGRSVSLRIEEDKSQRWRGIIGTSEDCVRMLKRSFSTGGLTFTLDDDDDGRGKDYLLPA